MTDEDNQNNQDAAATQASDTVTDLVGSTARHVIIPLKSGGGKR